MKKNITKYWYEKEYKEKGLNAQRLYPNEELLRFLGREFFHKKNVIRHNIKILEVGCGSCRNVWMLAREGFCTYGIDFSLEAIRLGKTVLKSWGDLKANLIVGDIKSLPYKNNYFDVVLDVYSSCCLCMVDFKIFLKEIYRILKTGGMFFSFSPSTNSDAFKNHYPAKKIDKFTIDGIKRKTSMHYGNKYPFRFISSKYYKNLLENLGFSIKFLETTSQTYNRQKEKFENIIIVGKKSHIDSI